MRKQDRLEEPAALRDGAAQWTAVWIGKQNEKKPWRWPVKDGQSINLLLLEPLRKQTANHCSFCDGFPVESLSVETIEHFHPKSSIPEKAFEWRNLFYCCTRCQAAKKENFDPLLLKPDEPDYVFNRYFICDYTTGRINPNPRSNEADQKRAETTITLYDLNGASRPESRRMTLRHWRNESEGAMLDEFAFRDFIC